MRPSPRRPEAGGSQPRVNRHAPPSSSASLLSAPHDRAERGGVSTIIPVAVIILDSWPKVCPMVIWRLENGRSAQEREASRRLGHCRRRFDFTGRKPVSKLSRIFTSVAAAALSVALIAPAHAADIVGLITKTNTNPFFVKMKQGFEAKAKELGLTPQAYAGKFDGDNDGQVAAIEQLMAAGAKGILLVPSDSTAIVPTVGKARKAGIVVITLDTPLDPVTAADANFATDNFKAGDLIGEWAKATLGDKAATAKIATLDLASNEPT